MVGNPRDPPTVTLCFPPMVQLRRCAILAIVYAFGNRSVYGLELMVILLPGN
jgi:hypothetical protein